MSLCLLVSLKSTRNSGGSASRMYRALIRSPQRMKNRSVAGAHKMRNASPRFLPEAIKARAAAAKAISTIAPDEARAMNQRRYPIDGHEVKSVSKATVTTPVVIGIRLPVTSQGNTPTLPTKLRTARLLRMIEPWDARYLTVTNNGNSPKWMLIAVSHNPSAIGAAATLKYSLSGRRAATNAMKKPPKGTSAV